MSLEKYFQKEVINDLKNRLPGCMIIKTDPTYKQGIPDLLILYGERWATLEMKRGRTSKHQPNQDYYVELMDKMSFSRFIYPDIKDRVLDDLEDFMRS